MSYVTCMHCTKNRTQCLIAWHGMSHTGMAYEDQWVEGEPQFLPACHRSMVLFKPKRLRLDARQPIALASRRINEATANANWSYGGDFDETRVHVDQTAQPEPRSNSSTGTKGRSGSNVVVGPAWHSFLTPDFRQVHPKVGLLLGSTKASGRHAAPASVKQWSIGGRLAYTDHVRGRKSGLPRTLRLIV